MSLVLMIWWVQASPTFSKIFRVHINIGQMETKGVLHDLKLFHLENSGPTHTKVKTAVSNKQEVRNKDFFSSNDVTVHTYDI